MPNYMVTGSAGFIAYRITQMLLESGHNVTGLDNLNDAYDVRMKNYRLSLLEDHPQFRFFRVDITDRQALEAIFQQAGTSQSENRFEGIINLAARAGVRQSLENPWVYVDTNVTGTLNLLELCHRYGVPKFVLASTSSIYGQNAPLPTPEEADSSHPLQPYAASKKGAEALCHAYHYLYDLDVTVFRYFTVYGPAGRPDMVMFRFTQSISEGRTVKINGDGEQKRGFTFLDDIARGTILGLKPLGYEVINLGGHEVVSVNDLVRRLEKAIGKKAKVEYLPRHPADMLANWAQVEKARRLLGWEAQVDMQEGISKLVDWYTSERSWASEINTE